MFCSNGVEEPMEEPAPEPEPEPEPEPKAEDTKPEADEKVLEEMEEKAPSPVPVESPPNSQEPPKVMLMSMWCSFNIYSRFVFNFIKELLTCKKDKATFRGHFKI